MEGFNLFTTLFCSNLLQKKKKKNTENPMPLFPLKQLTLIQLPNACNLCPLVMDGLIILKTNKLSINFENHVLEFQLQLLKPSPSRKWGAKEYIWEIHL